MNVSTASNTLDGAAVAAPGLGAAAIVAWGAGLVDIARDVSNIERIDQLRALERVKAQSAAAQA